MCLKVGVSSCPRLWLLESLVTFTSINRLNVFILVERFVVCFLIFCLRSAFGPEDNSFSYHAQSGNFYFCTQWKLRSQWLNALWDDHSISTWSWAGRQWRRHVTLSGAAPCLGLSWFSRDQETAMLTFKSPCSFFCGAHLEDNIKAAEKLGQRVFPIYYPQWGTATALVLVVISLSGGVVCGQGLTRGFGGLELKMSSRWPWPCRLSSASWVQGL